MAKEVTIQREIEELRQLSVPALVARYRGLFGREPRVKGKEWLWKRCAWKLEEQRSGGLSERARRMLEDLVQEIDFPAAETQRTISGKLKHAAAPNAPPVGTTIVRRWRDQELRLIVREDGFELDGVVHRSLSAAARAVTGSRWNGPLFWGVSQRKRKS